jgi:hypothetical protein
MKKAGCSLIIFLCLTASLCTAAAPKPAIIQKPNEWTVDVRFTNPQQIILNTEGGNSVRYWYTILTVTNKTDREVDFYPRCEVATDTFQLITAGNGTPDEVFEAIKKRHSGTYPFFELLEKTSNKLLVGEDNAKDIAIVWPDFDPQAKSIKLFISGLSNEIAVVSHPLQKLEDGNPVKVFLRKTLQLNYDLGGDPAFRNDAKLDFTTKTWIMR